MFDLLRGAAAGGEAAFARDISPAEKALRSVRALTAFGLPAQVEDGHVVLQPWAEEEEDQLLQAVLALLDLRYPDA